MKVLIECFGFEFDTALDLALRVVSSMNEPPSISASLKSAGLLLPYDQQIAMLVRLDAARAATAGDDL
jgi:hypothetical protein